MQLLSENALKVLQSRYLRKSASGDFLETPDELFHRVADAVAQAELIYGSTAEVKYWENEFYQLMSNLLFLPNSPTLMNAGSRINQLSACFVLPVEDSIESIFNTLKNSALVHQSGGGTGFNFSAIRPKNDFVEVSSGEASGPLSFMKVYDAATENIKQGGKRRGANMGILNISHPDIEEFITSKNDENTLRNFNISVGITDDFMQAVLNDGDWKLTNPINSNFSKTIKAKQLWNLIIENAWKTGDPGLVFLDEINKHNPTPLVGRIECTNPCGEVPLLPYEACNLGSINISEFILNKDIDWERLEKVVSVCIRFLDNVIDVNHYIIPEIKKMVTGNRKIGLGIMGWAELLIKLEIPYDSQKAVDLGEKLMRFINERSFDASVALANERGAFPNWEKSVYNKKVKIRNATRTSIAPTGTISIIANASSSIEPLFALAYVRENVLDGKTLYEVNKLLKALLEKNNLFELSVVEEIMKAGALPKNIKLSNSTKEVFKTALEIDPIWHIKHQVAFQKHTDNAVSKTINLPEHSRISDVENIYLTAWKEKAKGITIYRYNSKSKQVLNTSGSELSQQELQQAYKACKVC